MKEPASSVAITRKQFQKQFKEVENWKIPLRKTIMESRLQEAKVGEKQWRQEIPGDLSNDATRQKWPNLAAPDFAQVAVEAPH